MEKASAAYRQEKAAVSPVGRQYSFDTIVGKSPAIQEAIALARKVAQTDVPVLLTGETGTGKEVFAQSIHQHSSRSGKPLWLSTALLSAATCWRARCSAIKPALSRVL